MAFGEVLFVAEGLDASPDEVVGDVSPAVMWGSSMIMLFSIFVFRIVLWLPTFV